MQKEEAGLGPQASTEMGFKQPNIHLTLFSQKPPLSETVPEKPADAHFVLLCQSSEQVLVTEHEAKLKTEEEELPNMPILLWSSLWLRKIQGPQPIT